MDFQDQLKVAVDQQRGEEEERMQLRVALALSLETNNNNDNNNDNNSSNPTDATMQQQPPQQLEEETWKQPKPFNISDFHAIMWGPTSTDNDKARWVGQGIDTQKQSTATTTTTTTKKKPPPSDSSNSNNKTSRLTMVGEDHGAWGLIQDHGGPCGVLAAIQAELLRLILFGKRNPISYTEALNQPETTDRPDPELSESLLDQCLAQSIAVVLARAAVMPPTNDDDDDDSSATRAAAARVVLPQKAFVDSTTPYESLEWQDLKPWTTPPGQDNVMSSALCVYTIPVDNSSSTDACVGRLTHQLQLFLQSKPSPTNPQTPLDCFRKPGGVILLVMSLVCCRGSSVISNDMDDPSGTKLTSQFGHCGQELMNLLLTGQAVSNVFDNTMTVSGAFTCRGIQSRPAVGYLSQLEALRYCEVGGYYKSPKFPIWVVGSTSHFTVMFGDASSLKESKSDELLERCRRAFKEVDGEENGFISRIHLAKVFELLDLNVGSEHAIQTLAATLEVSGADIILWDDFWKVTSRLLTGATLDSVLQGDTNTTTNTNEPPKMLTLYGEPPSRSNEKQAALTDEELAAQLNAKELEAYQKENDMKDGWKEMVGFTPAPAAAAAAPMTDEEYARKLQAQWDAEATTGVVEDDANTQTAVAAADDDVATLDEEEEKTAEKPFFEKFGNTFPLYHYNGMRGGTLTPFRVTRLTPEEAVGASIALGANGGGTGQSGGGDLEDVVRTKWPSCMVNWLGKAPPYID